VLRLAAFASVALLCIGCDASRTKTAGSVPASDVPAAKPVGTPTALPDGKMDAGAK
jgi:hypothetical protein